MSSPFTFKRLLILSLGLGALLAIPAALLLAKAGQYPIWYALIFAPIVCLILLFNLFVCGEVAWRGYEDSYMRSTSLIKTVVLLAAGIGIIILSPHFSGILQKMPDEIIIGIVGSIGISILGITIWRNWRNRLRMITSRKIIFSMLLGIGLIVFAPFVPEFLWSMHDTDDDGSLHLIGIGIVIYAFGKLVGIAVDKLKEAKLPDSRHCQ